MLAAVEACHFQGLGTLALLPRSWVDARSSLLLSLVWQDRDNGLPMVDLRGLLLLQVKGIPFLVFDAGGVLEMFDSKEFSDNVVFEPTLAALKRKLSSVVRVVSNMATSTFTSEIACDTLLSSDLKMQLRVLSRVGLNVPELLCAGRPWQDQDGAAGRAHHHRAPAVAAVAR